MHSMYLAGVPLFWSMLRQPIHLAWRHSDLVTSTVVADRCANSVSTVTQIITRLGRVVTAGVAHAVVDGVMPIVIVVGSCSVPTTVMSLERVMRPTLAGVSPGYRNPLTPKSQRPDIRRVRVIDPRFNRCRRLRLRRRFDHMARLRENILDMRIAFYSRHIATASQRLGNLAATFH